MTTLYTFVTGPSGSGKTLFMQSLGGPDGFWRDEDAGLEYCHLVVDDTLDTYLFSPMDASRFDVLLEVEERDLLGYIVVVDSTDPDTWAEAKAMIATCRGYALLPTVIAASKQDLPGASTPETLGAWIGMDPMMRVQRLVATDEESARGLLLQLLYSVQYEIDRLDALIAELERLAAESAGETGTET